ncbi:WbqC family protein [Aquiflexum gelatinilyticum]|uniref:WbqC family protein n=1 Tax=Aquiflexum gelatinilyticum TaxID=2961943 RepID=A0A9X2P5G9_9BACT|nr:WbqC family protein [Aquiflexum gelatinilyticum]MCR9014010.1 WbqC family protein [Aquiflexum gelatinilyticum]
MNQKKAIISNLFYLPPIEYFVATLGFEEIQIDQTERFQKQTLRNRANILLANKIVVLSVPVVGSSKKQFYKDVKIDYNQKWKNVHLRGIQSAYGKAPFFEYFYPYFDQIYEKNLTFLFDLNHDLLTVCLKLLRVKANLKLIRDCDLEQESIDLRGVIRTKEEFTQRDIMTPYHYPQMFGLDFVPNLSILDLLFCMGPESLQVLLHSKKNH